MKGRWGGIGRNTYPFPKTYNTSQSGRKMKGYTK
nr:MAG TPA: hypothetical protein [Caudoviricetes sp.]